MQYRKLGKTGLKVSCIGFGALPLAGLNEEEAYRVLNTALDHDINFIDTARGYRESEELIGKALSARRNEFYIATKTGSRTEEDIRNDLEISLENLKTEGLDLYQIHYVNTEEELEKILQKGGALEAIRKIQVEGTVKFVGITGHNSSVLLKAAETGAFDTVQGPFSYLEKHSSTTELIHYCAEYDIGFIVQKPLAGGVLTRAQAGLKWILDYPVSTVIPGMISVKQVIENTQIADGSFTPSDAELENMNKIVAELDKYFCRRCNYCHPACPENIPIGPILEFYGKAQFPENLNFMKRVYRGLEVNADNCTECGQCLEECPYDLPIVDMLQEAHTLLHQD